jgi:hypothetical protein
VFPKFEKLGKLGVPETRETVQQQILSRRRHDSFTKRRATLNRDFCAHQERVSENVFLIHKKYEGSAVDDKGQSYDIQTIQGVNSISPTYQEGIKPSDWTALTPGSVQTIVFTFTAGSLSRYQAADVASFAADFWIATQKGSASISIGFSKVALLG